MRFLTLFKGVGEGRASQAIGRMSHEETFDGCLRALKAETKIPAKALEVLEAVRGHQSEVNKAVSSAVNMLDAELSMKYRKKWDRKKRDFPVVERLAEKHTSIAEFIVYYQLTPVYGSKVHRLETEDAVRIITIHSAKGMESEVCYVINVSPGAYPSSRSQGNEDEVEEERRVLNVALTRAMDDLIVTRSGFNQWAVPGSSTSGGESGGDDSSYFFNDLPEGLFDEQVHGGDAWHVAGADILPNRSVQVGINFG